MKRHIITTADGSKTIQIEDWDEQYHSIHGAMQESQHVFIDKGLKHVQSNKTNNTIAILEIGFGTGLNAFLTAFEAEAQQLQIDYVGVEAYPVNLDEIKQLNYGNLVSEDYAPVFDKLHQISWENKHEITNYFSLEKQNKLFSEINDEYRFNLIYFDAFGARVQPELWTESIFESMYKALKDGGVLVTYSAKGSVKRAMQAVGFTVERLEGPPGKRHMLRAIKVKNL